MSFVRKRIHLAALALLILADGQALRADDTEVFIGAAAATPINNPNVLLVIDTSGDMAQAITTTTPYNPATTYVGSCDLTKVYYRRASDSAITCSTSNYASLTDFFCASAITAFAAIGHYQDAGIRWRKRISDNQYSWHTTFGGDSTYSYTDHITCLTNHGSSQYPYRGITNNENDRYSGTSASNYWSSGTRELYHFYSANYLNYLANGTTSTQSRLQTVKNAVSNFIDSVSNLNIGIMRYDSNGSGGMVIQPIQPIATGVDALKSSIKAMHACGSTPLSETLYEAYQYFRGGPVGFGNTSYEAIADVLDIKCIDEVASPSVAISRASRTDDGANYQSPITASCQKNHIVFLTTGLAQQDSSADTAINSLPGAACYDSQSSMWSALGVDEPSKVHDGGLCLKSIAQYMSSQDMSTSFADKQHINTHFISFENEAAGSATQEYLRDAARAGGGDVYLANDYTELTSVIQQIATEIREDSASFSSPQVVVNAFNKTQVLEDLYIAMFKPSTTTHWPGNVKKYKLRDSRVVGRGSSMNSVAPASAVDPATGFFTSASKDFWQQLSDEHTESTTRGGAANSIPDPVSRTIYTYIGAVDPTAPIALRGHPFTTSNAAIDNIKLRIGAAGDPNHDALINWARGDDDGDLTTTDDTRHEMGDAIHSQPAVVIYGTSGSTFVDQINDALVFTATNDGYLHAIDVVSGVEQWAFIPQELLGELKTLYVDAPSATKYYSLDGDIRVLKYDADGDGKVEPSDGDRVFLYFSQGRGGPNYYALDVTFKTNPKFLWSLNSVSLGGIVSQSWSTPTLGRVKVGSGSTQNSQRLVLIFGAGYDDSEKSAIYNSANGYGNGLFMVDAVKGTILWSQTKTASGAFARMTHSIPSNVTALDTDSDGWTDRMYVGDTAGQLWRFDITNGNSGNYVTGIESGAKLVAGGVIASLGGKESAAVANNRSFYNSPDVAQISSQRGANFYNIGIGSGDRDLPRTNNMVSDFFYSIRDYRMTAVTQFDYNSLSRILDGDLETITGASSVTFSGSSAGWKMALSAGEKSLTQSLTIDGVLLFTTYVPPSGDSETCRPSTGSARAYSVKVANAENRFAHSYEEFNTSGLPTQMSIVNESRIMRTDGTPRNGSTTGNGVSGPATCMSGVLILGQCVEFGRKVKTFWQESEAN